MAEINENIFDDVKVKQENLIGVCQGCLVEENLRDMNIAHYYNGKEEIFTGMIYYCFGIKVGECNKLICEVCIRKLRDATHFRSQVEAAQHTLRESTEGKSPVNDHKDFIDYIETNSVYSCADEKHDDDSTDKNEQTKDERQKKTNVQKNSNRKSICKGNNKRKAEMNRRSLDLPIKIENDDENKVIKNKLPYKLNKSELKCRICGESFHVNKSLVIHMSLHFPNLICEQCGRPFATRIQLRNHLATHVKERISCNLCLRKFKSNGSLRSHMRAHKGDHERYRCPVCLERFSTYSCRRKHMVKLHGEELRRYACKQCPKRFSLPTNLSAHVRNVHLRERNHICQQCGTGFFLKRGLDSHMLSHTGERNYKCSVCYKSYARKYTLDEHMKIHNNDRQHVCTVCGKAFTQKVTLKSHLQLHNKEKNLPVVDSSS